MEAALGALVVGVVVAFVWLTFAVGGGAPRGAVTYVLLFDSALGLSEDNSVAVAGVKVGIVDEIAVEGRKARVTIAIDKDVPLHVDARAAVRQKTLLGEKYVDLDPGSAGSLLAVGATIENNEPTVEIDQVIREVAVLVERLNKITPPLESAIARVDKALENQDGEQLASEIVGTLKDMRSLVKETSTFVHESGADARAVLAMAREKGPSLLDSLGRASARMDEILAGVDPQMIEDATARVAPAAENVEKITQDMKSAMSDMKDAAKRFDGVLARFDATLMRLQSVDEKTVREFFQVQGVRVNLIPDASVTTRIKKLRDESIPLPAE